MEENNEGKQEVEETDKAPEATSTEINTNDGSDVVAEAKKVNADLKKNLEQKAKLLEKEEKLVARQEALRALGGGSPAGQQAKPKEKTAKEYADEVMAGKIRAA